MPTGDTTSGRVQGGRREEGLSHCVKAPVILAHRARHLLRGKGCRDGCWRQEQGANRGPIQTRLDGAESHLFGAQTD